jgi:hypothetical protein
MIGTVTAASGEFKHLFEACRIFVGGAWYNSNMRSIEQSFEAVARPSTGQAPVHLTRRGRLVVVLLTLALLVAAGFTLGGAAGRAAGPSRPLPTVTVHPGETLWQIAARVAPHADRRVLVRQIEQLNDLSDGRVDVGQQLRLPR